MDWKENFGKSTFTIWAKTKASAFLNLGSISFKYSTALSIMWLFHVRLILTSNTLSSLDASSQNWQLLPCLKDSKDSDEKIILTFDLHHSLTEKVNF